MISHLLKETVIPRETYINAIQVYFNTPLVKVITWQRRVGKSSILKYLIQQLYHTKAIAKENFFYVDKELPKFSEIRTHHDLRQLFETFLQTTIAGRIFIGIDEIQDIQEREMFIRGVLAEYQEQAEIFITGSNGFLLSGDLATYLTGRYMEFTVYPLSFSEFCIFKNVKKIEAEFLEYLKYGGLPGIFKLEYHEKTIFEYLLSVYSSIVLKDIIQHQRVQNVDFFQNLYKYTLSNIGNIISGKSIRDYLQSQHIVISTDTVLNFLHYGEETFLLNKVKSVNPDTKKFFEIYNKYYAGDLGLRNAFVWFDETKDLWKVMENYVYLELKRHGYEVRIWRLATDKEVDFIAEKQGIVKYFQVAYQLDKEDTLQRELTSLEEVQDNREKYVVHFEDIAYSVQKGIKFIKVLELGEVM